MKSRELTVYLYIVYGLFPFVNFHVASLHLFELLSLPNSNMIFDLLLL